MEKLPPSRIKESEARKSLNKRSVVLVRAVYPHKPQRLQFSLLRKVFLHCYACVQRRYHMVSELQKGIFRKTSKETSRAVSAVHASLFTFLWKLLLKVSKDWKVNDGLNCLRRHQATSFEFQRYFPRINGKLNQSLHFRFRRISQLAAPSINLSAASEIDNNGATSQSQSFLFYGIINS